MDSKGKSFKGRKCAEKMNKDFQLMQADMYNLYPAIGAVNAIRSNFNYAELPEAEITFGACPMKIKGKKVHPILIILISAVLGILTYGFIPGV